jgi:DNA (cytosine-5)-methyltransferase 1
MEVNKIYNIRHGSLFSGIGGFDLAASWLNWENVFHCENNPVCQKVLKYHFPNSIQYGDIKQTDFTIHRGTIDILTGGFPCQPFSVAGKQGGNTDDRYLWPEMFRVIREVQPAWIVAENVPGIINMALDKVLDDLESENYACQTLIIPASGVGAWHKRERIWIIAQKSDSVRCNSSKRKEKPRFRRLRKSGTGNLRRVYKRTDATNSTEQGLQKRDAGKDKPERISEQPERPGNITTNPNQFNGNDAGFRAGEIPQQQKAEIFRDTPADTESQRLEGTDTEGAAPTRGRPLQYFERDRWTVEPGICGVANGIPRRVDRIKGLGNAIVPQIAFEIFKVIDELSKNSYSPD